MIDLKIPPHSVEAEQAVLACISLNNGLLFDLDFLKPSDFYRKEHNAIFAEMFKMGMARKPIDPVSLVVALSDSGNLEAAGGEEYVIDCLTSVVSTVNATHYAEIVRDKALARKLIATGTEIASSGYEPGDIQEKIDQAQKAAMEISTETKSETKSISSVIGEAVKDIQRRGDSDLPVGLSTGLKDLDKTILGLEKQDLIIIAGRPSMGKTALSSNIIEAVLKNDGFVVEFSLEMPAEQLMKRHFASLGRVDFEKIRTGKLDQDEWDKVNKISASLSSKSYFIDDNPRLTSNQILSRCRKIQQRAGKKIDLVVIDYLQLITDAKNENETQRISDISRNIKLTARELDCPIILLSQLNRSLEQRPNKRPIMADLRASGAIEQDADVIIFVYRDEVYNEDSEHKGVAELIVSKQRNGPIGTVHTSFIGKYCRFENFAADYQPRPFKQTKVRGFSHLDYQEAS